MTTGDILKRLIPCHDLLQIDLIIEYLRINRVKIRHNHFGVPSLGPLLANLLPPNLNRRNLLKLTGPPPLLLDPVLDSSIITKLVHVVLVNFDSDVALSNR